MSTTVLDAYVKPTVRRYLTRLSDRLHDGGIDRDTHFAMQSNGGVSRFDVTASAPINLVESGPVGGVIGAAVVGSAIDRPNLITFDVGGTTAKSSLIEGGVLRLTADYHIDRDARNAGYPVKVPVVDIVEIGVAGGSIAWIDAAGSMKVGPHSAGRRPGPRLLRAGRDRGDADRREPRHRPDRRGRLHGRPDAARRGARPARRSAGWANGSARASRTPRAASSGSPTRAWRTSCASSPSAGAAIRASSPSSPAAAAGRSAAPCSPSS